MTIGKMIHQWLIKLEWFSTLFPRIPVPMQKQIESKLATYSQQNNVNLQARYVNTEREIGGNNSGSSSGNGNKREGREYFDRNRERDREKVRNPQYRNEREEGNRRFRSRSPQERSYEKDSRDRHRERNSDRSEYSYKERSGGSDRREKDHYHRDGEGSSRARNYR